MRYLITGGEGFVGRNLKQKLVEENNEVLTLDLEGAPDFRLDIVNFDGLLDATKGIDGIFHLAAVTAPPQFEIDMPYGFKVNVNGTLNVLRAANENKVKRVVLASSSSVYGEIDIAGKENAVVFGHKNMYSTTKLFDEYLGRYYSLRNELEVVSLRFFNIYGYGENSKGMYSSVMSKFLDSIGKGEKPVIFGDGTQSRDFVFITDVAQAAIQAMQKGRTGQTYNIGTGISTQFNEIVRIMSKVLGREISVEYQPNPFKNYQFFTQADITKTSRELSWKAKYSLEDGIGIMAKQCGLIN